MNTKTRRIANILLSSVNALSLISSPAFAGAGTITTKDASGVTKTFVVTTDGSGNFNANSVICDQSAAANCATVDSNHNLSVSQATAANLNATVANATAANLFATVNNATAANLNMLATQTGTWNIGTVTTVTTVSTVSASRLVGNGGATLDAAPGAAPTNAVTVQGVAAMTPLVVTNLTAANLLAIASVTTWAGGALGAMANYGTSPGAVLVPGVNAFVTNATQLGQTTMASSSPVTLASNQAVGDPCTFQVKTNVPIATSTSPFLLVGGIAAKKVYVCSLSLITPAAISVSLSEGTNATCSTGTSAVIGAIGTATGGLAFAANGGLTLGAGAGTIAQTANSSSTLCLFQSSTAAIAGNLTYVQL